MFTMNEVLYQVFFFFLAVGCSYPTVDKNCPSSLQIADLPGQPQRAATAHLAVERPISLGGSRRQRPVF